MSGDGPRGEEELVVESVLTALVAVGMLGSAFWSLMFNPHNAPEF